MIKDKSLELDQLLQSILDMCPDSDAFRIERALQAGSAVIRDEAKRITLCPDPDEKITQTQLAKEFIANHIEFLKDVSKVLDES